MCYPRVEKQEVRRRLDELRRLGVKELVYLGRQKIGSVSVLGKGCVGIVIGARVNSRTIALKIRRTDADRTSMKHEATMLEKANSVDVGPKLLGYSDNFLLMELIDGQWMDEWMEQHSSERDKDVVKNVLKDILDQCFRLDDLGLDHGELSKARRHLLVEEDHPRIVDFETASTSRKPANVSSMCQYLFVSSNLALRVGRLLGKVELYQLKQTLAGYKRTRNLTAFAEVVRACKIL